MGLVLGVLFTTGCYIGCKNCHSKVKLLPRQFHLFFAIEHAQKLKSLVEVAENLC